MSFLVVTLLPPEYVVKLNLSMKLASKEEHWLYAMSKVTGESSLMVPHSTEAEGASKLPLLLQPQVGDGEKRAVDVLLDKKARNK